MYTKKQKLLAQIICILFLCVTAFSMIFLAEEADHQCTDTQCPVCTCIHQIEQALKTLGTGTISGVILIPVLIYLFVCSDLQQEIILNTSLISQKVRLDE